MLAVIGDLEARHPRSAEPVDERGQRAVALAGKLDGLAVAEQERVAADLAVAALGFEALKLPGGGTLDVFAPEHALELSAADLAAEPVHFLVGDGAKLA